MDREVLLAVICGLQQILKNQINTNELSETAMKKSLDCLEHLNNIEEKILEDRIM